MSTAKEKILERCGSRAQSKLACFADMKKIQWTLDSEAENIHNVIENKRFCFSLWSGWKAIFFSRARELNNFC